MRVAVATCREMPSEFTDDRLVIEGLEAQGAEVEYAPWDSDIAWNDFDVVAVRSPWDYSLRRDEFLDWADAAGPNLHNAASVLRWNSDKTYLADLAEAGLATIETAFLQPGEAWEGDDREVVVKPSVSAGGRHTGRFRREAQGDARELIAEIHESGRTAMVQPFQDSVDSAGETALVFIDGGFSHSLRKRAVLRPDEVAPMRETGIMAAEVMYEPDLVRAGSFEPDELQLAERVVSHVAGRFAYMPLYARVDMLRDEEGEPLVLELEAIEPNLYFGEEPAAAERLAAAITARANP